MANELPVGTVLAAGDNAPPTEADKTIAAVIWGAIPAVLAVLATWLESAPNTFPSVDPQVWGAVALILTIATPILAAVAVYRKPNKLTQPVKVISAPGQVIDGV